MPIKIRRALPADAAAIAAIWKAIVAESTYSAVDRPFSTESEREVVGFQSLDQWTHLYHSMDHVGQLGTLVLHAWRGRGVGKCLAEHTLAFARSAQYEKLVIYVRASNAGAQAFYARLGFEPCGRLSRQVKIGGEYDDEIIMQFFVSTGPAL